jgi:hypothetical protein
MSYKSDCLECTNFKNLVKRNIKLLAIAGALLILSGFFYREIVDRIVLPIDFYLYNHTTWINHLIVFIGLVVLLIIDSIAVFRYSRKEFKITYFVGFTLGSFILATRIWGDCIFDYQGLFIPMLGLNLTFLDASIILLLAYLYIKFLYELAKATTRIDHIEYTFLSDSPPSDIKHDKLGMRELTKRFENVFDNSYPNAFTIGINAGWGKGKSTFINFLKQESKKKFKDDLIFYEFNPYEILNDKSIELSFFEGLKGKFATYDRNISNKIDHYINDFIKEKKGVLSIFYGALNKTVAIDDISECLSCVNKKLVIVIDDIDRLIEIEDIIATFQLVRNIGSFKRTYVILCYDKLNVNRVFKRNKIDTSYLDKIVNYEFSLPPLDEKSYFNEYLKTSLHEIMTKAFNIESEIETNQLNAELQDLCFLKQDSDLINYRYLKGAKTVIDYVQGNNVEISISDFFNSFRDLKRFLISFSIEFAVLKNRTEPLDYIFFHIYKYKQEEYDKILPHLKMMISRKKVNYRASYFNYKAHWKLINNQSTVDLNKQPFDHLLQKIESEPDIRIIETLKEQLYDEYKIDLDKFKANYSIQPKYQILLDFLFLEKDDDSARNFRSTQNAPYYIYESYSEFEIHETEALSTLNNIQKTAEFNAPKIRNLVRWLVNNYPKVKTEKGAFNALQTLIQYCEASQNITSAWEYYYNKLGNEFPFKNLSSFILPLETRNLILDTQILAYLNSVVKTSDEKALLSNKLKVYFSESYSSEGEFKTLLAWYGYNDSINNVTHEVHRIAKENNIYQIGNIILGPDPAPGIVKNLTILYKNNQELEIFSGKEHNYLKKEKNKLSEIDRRDIATVLKDMVPTNPYEDYLSGNRQWIHDTYTLVHDFKIHNILVAVDCKLIGTQWEIVVFGRPDNNLGPLRDPLLKVFNETGINVEIREDNRLRIGLYEGEYGMNSIKSRLLGILDIIVGMANPQIFANQFRIYAHSSHTHERDITENHPIGPNTFFVSKVRLNDPKQSFTIYYRVVTSNNERIWFGFGGRASGIGGGRNPSEYTIINFHDTAEVIINVNVANHFREAYPERGEPIIIDCIRLRADDEDMRPVTYSYSLT